MRGLLIASILIVAAAVAAPRFLSQYVGSRSGTPDSAPMAAEASASPDDSADAGASDAAREVEIKAGRDGHFYVDASINFRPVHLMVDTGATVVALRVSDAAAAGIHVRDSDFVDPVQTANGTTNAAEATLESVSISDIEVRNIRALIVPDDRLSVSLLGGSFLHNLRRFEITDNTLTIAN